MSTEAIELRKTRDRLAALNGAEWLLSSDGVVTFIEARHGHERSEIARFHKTATSDEIDFFANAPHMIELLLRLVDRAIAAARHDRPRTQARSQGKVVNYAAEAAMKCGEPAFLVFLEQRHGLERPLTDDKAA